MTRKQHHEFVRDLIRIVTESLDRKLPKCPESWDGHDLRQFVADHFAHEVASAIMTGRRLKRYRNDVLANNLD